MASLAKFNLMRSLLKGRALWHFNNKAQELKTETNAHHKLCINMVSEHIFPKNALQMQKCYLQKVRLHGLMTISKYFAHWHQINDYLTLFPLHGGAAQKLRDNKIVELIYEQLLNHMQSDLERMNELTSITQTWCSFVRSLSISNSPINWKRNWENPRNWRCWRKMWINQMVSSLERSMPTLLTNHCLPLPRSRVCFMGLALTPQMNARWWKSRLNEWRQCVMHKIRWNAPRNARKWRPRRLPLWQN